MASNSIIEIACPSGLRYLSKPIGGNELIRIVDRAKPGAADVDQLPEILSACWLRCVEPGPYSFIEAESTAAPPWSRMLLGDCNVAVLRLRSASFARLEGTYEFDFPCVYQGCGKLTAWTISIDELLGSELYRELSPDTFMNVVEGRPLTYRLGGKGGLDVRYNLATHAMLRPMRDLLKKEGRKMFTDVERVAQQLSSVEGLVDPKTGDPKKQLRDMWNWARARSAGELDELLEEFERHDCGVDTEVRAACDHCGKEQDVSLPFGRTFFAPRSSTRKGSTAKPASGETSSQGSATPPSGTTSSTPAAGTPMEAPASPSPKPT